MPHLDAMRGLAVIFMLCMHSGDGWLAEPYRSGQPWDLVRAFGGLAAPLFLLLTGVSLGVARVRGVGNLPDELARAGQLLLLGYLLRIQMWMLDGAGYARVSAWLAASLLVAGHLTAFWALGRYGARKPAFRPAAGAGLLLTAGLLVVAWFHPARLAGLLRQDILQAIGACLAVTAVVTRWAGARGAALAAVLVALATHPMRSWVPGPLPPALAAYLAYWPPAGGGMPAGLFPLFPWLSYPLLGYAVGRAWGRTDRVKAEELAIVLCAGGSLLALASCELFDHVRQAMRQWPWLQQPLRVVYRVGVGLALAGLAVPLAHRRFPLQRPLLALGRASLCIYWVHLPLAFGSLGRGLHRQLSFAQWTVALALLTCAMAAVGELWLARRRLARRFALARPAAPRVRPRNHIEKGISAG